MKIPGLKNKTQVFFSCKMSIVKTILKRYNVFIIGT